MINQFFSFIGNNPKQKKFSGNEATFAPAYDYWLNYLMEVAISRFNWKGLPETIPEHELELILQMNGTCGITDKYKKTPYVYNGYWAGTPTVYFDRYEEYSIFSPLFSDVLKVDEEVIVGLNNKLQTPTYYLAHRYAMLLAHCEVSIFNLLINGRDSDGIPMVQTEVQKQAVESFRNNLCNGIIKPIQDTNAFQPIEFKGISKNIGYSLQELVETRENILNEYYDCLGIKTTWNKKGNMIADEIGGNDARLQQNILNALECRQELAKKLNCTCELSPYMNYEKEVYYESDIQENISAE